MNYFAVLARLVDVPLRLSHLELLRLFLTLQRNLWEQYVLLGGPERASSQFRYHRLPVKLMEL